MIDIYLIDPRIDSPLDIYLYAVPDHDTFCRISPRFAEGVFKDLPVRFEAIGALRSDHLPKITAQPGMLQLAVLGLFESVGDQMQPVSFAGQVMQDLQRIGEEDGTGRKGLQEEGGHRPRQRLIGDLKVQQRQPHPFPPQFIHLDKTIPVTFPQLIVMHRIVGEKSLEIRHPSFLQAERLIEILQRLPAIGLKIPQRMVQVEEKVFILHDAI